MAGIAYFCSMNNLRKEKFGDLLLDIAKYIITAVILATFFQGIGEWQWYTYIVTLFVVGFIILVALQLYGNNDNNRKKGNK